MRGMCLYTVRLGHKNSVRARGGAPGDATLSPSPPIPPPIVCLEGSLSHKEFRNAREGGGATFHPSYTLSPSSPFLNRTLSVPAI